MATPRGNISQHTEKTKTTRENVKSASEIFPNGGNSVSQRGEESSRLLTGSDRLSQRKQLRNPSPSDQPQFVGIKGKGKYEDGRYAADGTGADAATENSESVVPSETSTTVPEYLEPAAASSTMKPPNAARDQNIHRTRNPGPAYDLQRSEEGQQRDSQTFAAPSDSVDYSESTMTGGGDASIAVGPQHATTPSVDRSGDSTDTVHEMHLALLYLLSHPDEFSRAAAYRGPIPDDRNTLASWNASYDEGTEVGGASEGGETQQQGVTGGGASTGHTPLPYAIFAYDAEVVLPQAHTASQLFGLERDTGIELEAAAGVPSLSRLFLRWLALMPDGDHENIVNPPGLTVMRIAGGRYRCTAAHRVVWNWGSEFLPEVFSAEVVQHRPPVQEPTDPTPPRRKRIPSPTRSPAREELHMGDLVCMTIVDVFETDTDGRLLSYCPTFDNRDVRKTTAAAERLRKGGLIVSQGIKAAARSQTAARVNQVRILCRSVDMVISYCC